MENVKISWLLPRLKYSLVMYIIIFLLDTHNAKHYTFYLTYFQVYQISTKLQFILRNKLLLKH